MNRSSNVHLTTIQNLLMRFSKANLKEQIKLVTSKLSGLPCGDYDRATAWTYFQEHMG